MKKDNKLALVVFDIDGVIRDVSQSYRRAIADTVAEFTQNAYRPTLEDIDTLKSEGIWNNDWKASEELIYRYRETQGENRDSMALDYQELVGFFQKRYRGQNYDGYIATEPLLLSQEYLTALTDNNIGWGFFSGATRGSAEYVLKKRLGLENPILVAMEDAPGKPDPTGLLATVTQIEATISETNVTPVIYVGDTVADIYTVNQAREQLPNRNWIAVGVLPPHVQTAFDQKQNYAEKLTTAGAKVIVDNVEALNSEYITKLVS
ncbi:MAG TPA: TIGR01548 family HAD-type hydrolase [Xenococcaceae cyanobacterium]